MNAFTKVITNGLFLCVITLSLNSYAQVGINIATPENDLDVNGGLRIRNIPVGIQADAQDRLLAIDTDGDVVQVPVEQSLTSIGIPRLSYSAKYGTGGLGFFQDCEPCANGTLLPLYLNSPDLNFQNSNFITVQDPSSSTNGDEYFLIEESGLFRFEINANIELTGTNRYFINIRLSVDKATGPDQVDSFRVYAGQPAADNANGIAVPIYATDLREYEAGDRVSFSITPALISQPGLRRLKSTLATGATYIGQITVTKF